VDTQHTHIVFFWTIAYDTVKSGELSFWYARYPLRNLLKQKTNHFLSCLPTLKAIMNTPFRK